MSKSDAVKYIVIFQTTRRVGSEKRTRQQTFQYFAESAKLAKESAEINRKHLEEKTGESWIIEGVYVKCNC